MNRRLNPSMVVSLLALFVALSGTAYAGRDLILGSQIKDHTIGISKLTPVAVKLLHGQKGAVGPVGRAGAAGPAGASVPQSLSLIEVQGTPTPQCAYPGTPSCIVADARASCPSGYVAIGGGYVTAVPDDIVALARVVNLNQYQVEAINYFDQGSFLQAYAICLQNGQYTQAVSVP